MRLSFQSAVIVFLSVFGMLVWLSPISTADAKKVVIKLSDQVNEDSIHVKAHRHFAKLVAEKSNGSVEIKVFPSSQLGNSRESIEGLQLGTVEAVKVAAGFMSTFVKEFGIFNLPYVFTDPQQVKRAVEGELGARLDEKLAAKNYKVLMYYDAGFRSIFNSVRPVNSMADLKGLKIRVMNDPLMMKAIDALGAMAVPMAYGELYNALQQKVVDGGENPPMNYYSMKFYEVAKYYSLTRHFYDLNMVVMSKSFFDKKLDADQQKALLEAAKETQEFEWKANDEFRSGIMETLKKVGVVISEPDLRPFQAAVKHLIEEVKSKGDIDPELIDLALTYSK